MKIQIGIKQISTFMEFMVQRCTIPNILYPTMIILSFSTNKLKGVEGDIEGSGEISNRICHECYIYGVNP